MRLVDNRLRGALALWFLTVAPAACGSSGSDDGTATNACASVNCNPTNDPTNPEPTGSAGETTGPAGPPMCTNCAADQVCVQGECTDVPDMCPCPLETYCNLAENKCVIGCTSDAECDEGRICDAEKRECFVGCREDGDCGKGQICEGLSCVAGCRDDAGCAAGEICDAQMCRPGCYADDDCPLEQLCDTEGKVCYNGCNGLENCGPGKICKAGVCQVGCLDNSWCEQGEICKADLCVPGCAGSDECGAGKACLDGKCVDGCKVDSECSLGQVCVGTKCVPGCGPPGGSLGDADLDRCPFGKSCLAIGCTNGANCTKFECSDLCDGECRSSADAPYICYGDAPGEQGNCMLECSYDGDCAADEYCAYHAVPSNPDITLCRSSCDSDADCVDAAVTDFPFPCECWMGQCTLDLGGFPTLCTYNTPENK